MHYSLKNPPKVLQEQDTITFLTDTPEELVYCVNFNHLGSLTRGANETIFNALGLDKERYTSLAYGYRNRGGDWPTAQSGDFQALTRVSWALLAQACKIEELPDPMIFVRPEEEIKSWLACNTGWNIMNSDLVIPVLSMLTKSNLQLRYSVTDILKLVR